MFYDAHKIWSIESWKSDRCWLSYTAESAPTNEPGGNRRFVISNNREPPKINGFCCDDDVYGIMVEVHM